jgi:hypothetical protein
VECKFVKPEIQNELNMPVGDKTADVEMVDEI